MSEILPTLSDPRIHAAFDAQHRFTLRDTMCGWIYTGSLMHGTRRPDSKDVDMLAVVDPPELLYPFTFWKLQQDEIDLSVVSIAWWLRGIEQGNQQMLATLDETHGLPMSSALRGTIISAIDLEQLLRDNVTRLEALAPKLVNAEAADTPKSRKSYYHALRCAVMVADFGATGQIHARADESIRDVLVGVRDGAQPVAAIVNLARDLLHGLQALQRRMERRPDGVTRRIFDKAYVLAREVG